MDAPLLHLSLSPKHIRFRVTRSHQAPLYYPRFYCSLHLVLRWIEPYICLWFRTDVERSVPMLFSRYVPAPLKIFPATISKIRESSRGFPPHTHKSGLERRFLKKRLVDSTSSNPSNPWPSFTSSHMQVDQVVAKKLIDALVPAQH